MARRDLDPDQRDKAPLVLEQLHDCVSTVCAQTFEVTFVADDGVFDAEDMVEPPTTTVTCPACGRVQSVTYSGWSVNDES